jgi:hypothetical protein
MRPTSKRYQQFDGHNVFLLAEIISAEGIDPDDVRVILDCTKLIGLDSKFLDLMIKAKRTGCGREVLEQIKSIPFIAQVFSEREKNISEVSESLSQINRSTVWESLKEMKISIIEETT